MLTDNKVLYAPIKVVRGKSVKVTVTRAKSTAFKLLVVERTAKLVASATGFQPLFRNSCEGSMYQ